MASPCEILARCSSQELASDALSIARSEAERVERKFSRFREDNIIHRIHSAAGQPVELDEETSDLLDFAQNCWEASDGAFDITSGVLRRVWRFTPESTLPAQSEIDSILPLIGWDLLSWERPFLTLPPEMEIDLGGIGKEYAVDRVVAELNESPGDYLVNFGGDIRTTSSEQGESWVVGIDSPTESEPTAIKLERGALATSGDTHRFVLHKDVRYGHVLDPRTGWPPPGAPRTTTVHAETCLEAGLLATLSILHGRGAAEFLRDQDVNHWVRR